MTDQDIIDEWGAVCAAQKAPSSSRMGEVIAAATKCIGALESRLQHAARLLRTVIIANGAGKWSSDAARDEWCSSYKDFSINATQIERDYEMERCEREAKFWSAACAGQMNDNARLRHLLLDVKHTMDELPDLARLRPTRDKLSAFESGLAVTL